MKKQLILGIVFGVIIFGFGPLNSALAIVNQPIDITSLGDEVGLAGEPIAGVDTDLGKNLGGLMVSSDLGVDDVGTLPTSNFYFFKQWGRGIQRFFTLDSVAKAELELNITNQTAAELLEVEKTYEACAANALGGGKSCKPEDKVGSVKNALQNFTDAQERLNTRLAKLTETSENPNVEKLLKEVDDKTTKHVELLEQLTVRLAGNDNQEEYLQIFDEALNNTLKTFTVTVTPINDAPSLKLKAEEQIKRAGVAISEANSTMQEVSTARGINVNPGGSDARGSGKVVETIDEQSSIFDRWGKMIAKAKGNLESAKKAFAEGKYGEAYGQARSAEAIVAGIGTILNDDSAPSSKAIVPINGDTTQENDETFSTKKESPKIETPTPSIKPSASPTTRPTPEKTETPQSSGSSAGPTSNYDR